MKDTLEVLDDLISHPGWAAFCNHVTGEWGPMGSRFHAELTTALNLTDNDAAASQARQIVSGQKVILALLRWPEQELARLKRLKDVPADETGDSAISDAFRRGGYE